MSTRSGFTPLFLMLSLACASPHALAENLQGHAKGFITPALGLAQNGAPLLQSFYFRYTRAGHHIAAIEAVPNAPAIDKASLAFSDRNHDDQYFYNVAFAPYFGEIFRRTEGREHCLHGHCTFPLQAPQNRADYVFVLRGFYIYYVGDDHHIDQIRVEENDGLATVAFNDKNDDDRFRVDLHYAYIPKARVASIGEQTGTAKGGERRTIPSGTAVIRGFDLDFRHKDRHVRDVGVMLNGSGGLEVYYGDKTPDDSFDWKVRYAVLSNRPVVLDPNRPVLEPAPPITQ